MSRHRLRTEPRDGKLTMTLAVAVFLLLAGLAVWAVLGDGSTVESCYAYRSRWC